MQVTQSDMLCVDEEGCFTFTWDIENFDIFLRAKEGRLLSPAWKTETKEEISVWWQVQVIHRGSSIEFELNCLNQKISLDRWEPSAISLGSKISPINHFLYLDYPSKYFVMYNKSDIFINKIQPEIHLHCLKFQCKMFSNSMKSNGFRTHSAVKKVIFCWCPEDPFFFSPSPSPYSHNKIIEKDNIRINMILECKGENDMYYICALALPIIDGCFSFVDCNVVWDCTMAKKTQQNGSAKYNGSRTEYKEEWTVACRLERLCWGYMTQSLVTRNGSCKFNLQLDTIVAHHNNSQYQITHPDASSSIAKTKGSSEAVNDPLSEDLLQLYKEGVLSDVTINTEGKSFSAHKSILAARSPVFRAMFEKDEMSEGRSGVVDIDDVDSETMNRMLVFMYGDPLQGLQWREAAQLYYAADKYAVQPLKQNCADILTTGLTVDNVCDALALADTHSDEHLMKLAMDFIYDHQEVVSSPKFDRLEDIKPRLTSKVTKKLLLKRLKK